MKNPLKLVDVYFLFIIFFSLIGLVAVGRGFILAHRSHPPVASAPAVADPLSKQYVAAIDVARVFGRSPGCADADPQLIDNVASEAVKNEMDPRILAATVAVESSCNQFAVSGRGAIGLTQIVAATWKDKFDFAGSVNLLNRSDNLRAGAVIESGLIKQFGLAQGVRRFQGLGVGCPSCDDNYVPKILSLAGRK